MRHRFFLRLRTSIKEIPGTAYNEGLKAKGGEGAGGTFSFQRRLVTGPRWRRDIVREKTRTAVTTNKKAVEKNKTEKKKRRVG